MLRLLIVLSLALALAACGASPERVATASAQTQAVEQTTAAAQAQTQTAGAPTATATATNTKVPTATNTKVPTATPTAVPTDTATPEPSDTPEPTATATPAVTNTKAPPAASPVPPSATPQPAPDFVTIAIAVRAQVDSIGGQIDSANRSGFIDCDQLVASYEYIVARHDLSLPPELAGPYALYQAGIDRFTTLGHELYDNCVSYIADPDKPGAIPNVQGRDARFGVSEGSDLLRQSIVAAGGTP